MLAAIEAPSSGSCSSPTSGRATPPASCSRRADRAAGRGVEVYAVYDGFANLVVSPLFKRFGPRLKVLRVPRLQRRLAVLRPAPLRPRPPQDPRRRRRGRVRRRLQHRLGLRHRVARHARADHRARGLGPSGRSRTSGTSTGARHGVAAAAARDGRRLGAADPGAPQRAAALGVPDPVDVPGGDQPGLAPRLDDARLLHPGLGLRRGDQGRPRAAGSTYASCCRRRPTTSSPTGSPAATTARCSPPACGSSGSRAPWCTRRPSTIDGSWSTVGTANIDRLIMTGNYEINVEFVDAVDGRGDGADLRDRPVELRRAHRHTWAARGLHRRFTERSSRRCARCSEPEPDTWQGHTWTGLTRSRIHPNSTSTWRTSHEARQGRRGGCAPETGDHDRAKQAECLLPRQVDTSATRISCTGSTSTWATWTTTVPAGRTRTSRGRSTPPARRRRTTGGSPSCRTCRPRFAAPPR